MPVGALATPSPDRIVYVEKRMMPPLSVIMESLCKLIKRVLEVRPPSTLEQISDGPHRVHVSELPGRYRALGLLRVVSVESEVELGNEVYQRLEPSLGHFSISAGCGLYIIVHLSLRGSPHSGRRGRLVRSQLFGSYPSCAGS
jgi:hypothetical protein